MYSGIVGISPAGWRMPQLHPSGTAFSTDFQLILGVLLCFSLFTQVHSKNPSAEVGILLQFKTDNIDSNSQLITGFWMNWNASAQTPCGWPGVTCTPHAKVSELDLSGWDMDNLKSFSALGGLKKLSRLDLSSNNLNNFIPQDVGYLTRLTHLDLSQSHLIGEIPSNISACQGLRFLSLQQNNLSGPIPTSLSRLRNLQFLLLGGSQLSGPIPQELGEMSSLVDMDLSNNILNGSILSLPNLASLLHLKLDNNNFTEFEENWFLGSFSILETFSVSFNQLQGTIPSILAVSPNLAVLNMSHNQLVGDVPFGALDRLVTTSTNIDLSQNLLNGTIPDDILQWNYPGNSTANCVNFNLSHNLLNGNLPSFGIGQHCLGLDFSFNNLSGPLPPDYFTTDSLFTFLWLQNNQLSGDIVEKLANSSANSNSSIGQLLLQNNSFTGDLSLLANVSLAGTQYPFIHVLDLSNNNLQWSTSKAFPDPIVATLNSITSGTQFTELRVGGNNFSGTSLPTTCFLNQSSKLTVLDISDSGLDGKILGSVFNSTCLPSSLQILNLSYNHIIGSVPEASILIPSLQIFDLSNNSLSGPLPYIPPNSNLLNPSFFAGNEGLCGYPLRPCPTGEMKLKWWVFLVTIGGSVAIAVASCLFAMWRWRVYSRKHKQDADLIRTLTDRDSATLMSLKELKKATNNFDASAKIGEGGSGAVYRGKLTDGTVVAIKRSKRQGSEKYKEQFLNEVKILSSVNHRNLVKLLGCSMEDKIAVLVYEFVPNGTLQQHLRGQIADGTSLTWKNRLNIAVQTADALNYLLLAATYPIYHRDVKSSNILLDNSLNAKVADFGISKLAPVSATQVVDLVIEGTMGYIDPEYYTTYLLTDKSDVFSFGVVLLELISAKSAVDFERGGDDTSLVNFASPHVQTGDLTPLIDPALLQTYIDPTDFGKVSILKVGKLAIKCTQLRSKDRPSMNQVLIELQNIWIEHYGIFKHLNSITETEHEEEMEEEDPHYRDERTFFARSFSSDRYSPLMRNELGGIQMSQFNRSKTLSDPNSRVTRKEFGGIRVSQFNRAQTFA